MSERTFEPLENYERLSLLKRMDHAAYMKETDQRTRNRLTFYEAAQVLNEKQRAERAKDETHTNHRRAA